MHGNGARQKFALGVIAAHEPAFRSFRGRSASEQRGFRGDATACVAAFQGPRNKSNIGHWQSSLAIVSGDVKGQRQGEADDGNRGLRMWAGMAAVCRRQGRWRVVLVMAHHLGGCPRQLHVL